MYVRRLILKNIKGFRDLDFSFESGVDRYSGWYVITGENGAGKTVLLKSIAMALVGPEVIRALQPSLEGWVRDGELEGEIALQVVTEEFDRPATGRPYSRPFWSELQLKSTESGEAIIIPSNRRRGKEKGPLNGPWSPNTAGWFSAGYGPFRRLYGASPAAQRLMSGPERVARFATLFKEDATLEECEHWLRDLNYKKLESNQQAATLLEDTIAILNNDFLQNGLKVVKVDSNGLWLEDQRCASLNLSDMSEGYRAALAMMADILRQISIVYSGQRLIEDTENGIVVPFHGVVLIDEVDAHLHPEWQREIGFWLTRHFPNIQFIVTTHSPLVTQAAEPGAIYHLPEPGSETKPRRLSEDERLEILASKADTVLLSPAFGLSHTRSPISVQKRAEFAKLNSKRKQIGLDLDEKEKYKQLELFVGSDVNSDL
jgi:hypothetical protein